jgi:hypothetical protein
VPSCDELRIQTVKARKIVKQPGPYQSVLNSHLVEIAQLRETRPQPTPYRTIAKILKEKYRLEVSPNSIWSFVRARTLGRGRKLKYKIAPDLVQPRRRLLHPPDLSCRRLARQNRKLISGVQPLTPHAFALRRVPKNRKPKNGTWAMTRTNPSKTRVAHESK